MGPVSVMVGLKLEEDTNWTPDCKQETVGGKAFSPSVIVWTHYFSFTLIR